MKAVPFTVYPAEPTKVVIEYADGWRYEILLKVLVTEVVDNEPSITVQSVHGPVEVPNLTISTQTAWTISADGTTLTPVTGAGAKVSTGDLN